MIDKPVITQSIVQQAAVIHLMIPRSEIQKVMGPAIGEVMATIGAQGLKPAGPVFSHHFKMNPETFDFEVGVPVSKAVAPVGRVKPSSLPATKVARTIYRGGYEGLGSAWGEFCAWIKASNHKAALNLWECYVAGPESSPDSANWRTELNQPLIG